MIDIKPFIGELLRELVPIELSFNDNFISLPVMVITETENHSEVILSNTERVSRISVQLDIYADTAKEAEELSIQVNSILISNGFKRSFSATIYDEKYPRRCLRYDCGIDEVEKRILTL